MSRKPAGELRRGWTTGACASAATRAALEMFWGGSSGPRHSTITLPRGEVFKATIHNVAQGVDWARASIIKDAGDDPDVTHGVEVVVTVRPSAGGIVFKAGDGVGHVTKPGLPVAVGEPAINPVPRQMMAAEVAELAALYGRAADIEIEISIPGGEEIAQKTWNPRLGIKSGLSILGTTGIVRPFSCAAWIASIHRGIDVARAAGLPHVAGCTGATSERMVQEALGLPDHAMLDMGDFAGGMLKYLAKHPVERLTIGGGFGKLTKLAQGAMDLHSSRSQVDFDALSEMCGDPSVKGANTAMEAVGMVPALGQMIAETAREKAARMVPETRVEVIVVGRDGAFLGRSS